MPRSRHASDPLLFPLLEPPESKPEPPPPPLGGSSDWDQDLSETFRHSGWRRDRALVNVALRRTMQSVSRILAFSSCGSGAFVYESVTPPIEYRLGGTTCRDRFCVPCARDRSRVLATNVLTALGGHAVRFLTLTLRINPGPLSKQIDRLFTCFSALRQRAFWKKRVSGGCAFVEVKWSERHGGWNVHVHCMLHGLYLPKSDVWRAWYAITGDSNIVDIRLVNDKAVIGRYVTKYVSKPLNNTFLNRPDLFDELILAMVGRRLCLTFGDWRGIPLTQSPEPGEWINLGSFHAILSQALDGDAEALHAIRYICGDQAHKYLDASALARPPPSTPAENWTQLQLQFPEWGRTF